MNKAEKWGPESRTIQCVERDCKHTCKWCAVASGLDCDPIPPAGIINPSTFSFDPSGGLCNPPLGAPSRPALTIRFLELKLISHLSKSCPFGNPLYYRTTSPDPAAHGLGSKPVIKKSVQFLDDLKSGRKMDWVNIYQPMTKLYYGMEAKELW